MGSSSSRDMEMKGRWVGSEDTDRQNRHNLGGGLDIGIARKHSQ